MHKEPNTTEKEPIEFKIGLIVIVIGVIIFVISSFYFSVNYFNNYFFATKKIITQEAFDKAMENNTGDVLIEGTFYSLQYANVPELIDDYFYIEKIVEKYEKVNQDSDNPQYNWVIDSEKYDIQHIKSFEFMSLEHNIDLFNFSDIETLILNDKIVEPSYVDRIRDDIYIYMSDSIRYYFKVLPLDFNGVLYANISNGKINPTKKTNHIIIFPNTTIDTINKDYNFGFSKI